MRSENVPESPSSALQATYFWPAGAPSTVFHLMPVGNAAPPRPRRPDCVTSSTIAAPSIASAFSRPVEAVVRARSRSIDSGSVMPIRANVSRSCFLRYGISSVGPWPSAWSPPVSRPASSSDGDVLDGHRTVGDAALRRLDLDHRLQPEQAARTVADDLDGLAAPRALVGQRGRDVVGADRERGRIARHVQRGLLSGRHAAISSFRASASNFATLIREYGCSSIIMFGDMAHSPRQ